MQLCGILFAYVLFQSYHFDNIFRSFLFVLLGSAFFYMFYERIFADIDAFKKTKNSKSFSQTFVAILLILVNCGIYMYYEVKLNAPTLLKAKNHGVYADFKTNGKYVIKSGSWASKEHFYGTYIIKDSLITVDRERFDDILVSDKFVIRKIQNAFGEDDAEIKNYLIEVNQNGMLIKNWLLNFDKSGREIYDSFKFEIMEDNRK